MINIEYVCSNTSAIDSKKSTLSMYNIDLDAIGELFFEFDNLTSIILKNVDKYLHSNDSNYIRVIISLVLHELKQSPYCVFKKLSDMVRPIDEPDMTQSLYRMLNHFMSWREDPQSKDSYIYQFLLELVCFYHEYDSKYSEVSSK